ncbi:MAG: amidohydrolase family protein [Acidimicrobiia bacterium]|nr:amidohydrolase family protein [Acidimicrobiia bacterium]
MSRIVVQDAQLRGGADRVDIEIEGGLISGIAGSGTTSAAGSTVIYAAGGLVTESFVNAHLHLDKVFTLLDVGEEALSHYHGAGMGSASLAIDAAAEVKHSQNADHMLELARRSLAMAAYYGTTHVRAMADVDSKAGTRGVEVLCAARDEFAGLVDVQVVAFPQDGMVREPGALELMRRSMELGAEVVGGIPWIEYTQEAMGDHIRASFDLAKEFDADVSMLLDDAGDPELRTLETMALEAIARGWHGRALAHHCRAMALYDDSYFGRLVQILSEAGISIVSDPHTGPLHARVGELMDAGINVILGQDDISDAYYAFGRNNMLEVAFLCCHLLWMMTAEGQERIYDAVTRNAAVGMNVPNHSIGVGNPANLVVHALPTLTEVLRFQAPPAAVVSHGRLVDLPAMKEAGGIPH